MQFLLNLSLNYPRYRRCPQTVRKTIKIVRPMQIYIINVLKKWNRGLDPDVEEYLEWMPELNDILNMLKRTNVMLASQKILLAQYLSFYFCKIMPIMKLSKTKTTKPI